MGKFYAVRKGRKAGVYMTWPECEAQIKNFSGAQFKSFATRAEAEAFVNADVGPFYAVRRGIRPGIYPTWAECEKQTKNFRGAEFRKFDTRAQADSFMQERSRVSAAAAASASAPAAGSRNSVSGSFYGVQRGRKPGVYLSWAECEAQTKGFDNPWFKKFSTRGEADNFVGDAARQPPQQHGLKRARSDDGFNVGASASSSSAFQGVNAASASASSASAVRPPTPSRNRNPNPNEPLDEREYFFAQVCTTIIGCHHVQPQPKSDARDGELISFKRFGSKQVKCYNSRGEELGQLPRQVNEAVFKFLEQQPDGFQLEAAVSMRTQSEKKGRKYYKHVNMVFSGKRHEVEDEARTAIQMLKTKKQEIVSGKEKLTANAVLDFVVAPEGGILMEDFGERAYKELDGAPRFDCPIIQAEKREKAKEPPKEEKAYFQDLYASKLSNIQPAAQPPKVITTMRRHQLVGLTWIRKMERERTVKDVMAETKKPSALFWKKKGSKEWENVMTNNVVSEPPQYPRGGMICDEMGLGKTLQMLAAVTDPRPKGVLGTVIVVPVSVLSAWVSQVEEHVPHLKICQFHGQNRKLDTKADVILTSYETLKASKAEFCSKKWHRLVIDESHELRNFKAKKFIACAELSKKCNIVWVVTGTPIQNSAKDLFSACALLKLAPFDEWSYFNRCILRCCKKGGDGMQKLVTLLSPFVLRRRKTDKGPDGKPIVDLPAKTTSLEYVEMSKQDRIAWDALWSFTKTDVNDGGAQKVAARALVGITRCRQFCCSLNLLPAAWRQQALASKPDFRKAADASQPNITTGAGRDKVYLQHLAKMLASAEEEICVICTESIQMVDGENGPPAILSPCKHIFHTDCIQSWFDSKDEQDEDPCCPTCRHEDGLRIIPANVDVDMNDTESAGRSAKMKRIIELIREHEAKPGKVVIFSQYKSFLALLKDAIKKDFNPSYCDQIDGSVVGSKRADSINSFQTNDTTQVLLCATKAAGVGVTLTAGSLVIISDPWWNPALEEQAEDRCHRIG